MDIPELYSARQATGLPTAALTLEGSARDPRAFRDPPSEVPPESQYLLEIDHSAMYTALYKDQAYWVLAMKAA